MSLSVLLKTGARFTFSSLLAEQGELVHREKLRFVAGLGLAEGQWGCFGLLQGTPVVFHSVTLVSDPKTCAGTGMCVVTVRVRVLNKK